MSGEHLLISNLLFLISVISGLSEISLKLLQKPLENVKMSNLLQKHKLLRILCALLQSPDKVKA
jgi:hypothetical protein